jgi:hypothetical protein
MSLKTKLLIVTRRRVAAFGALFVLGAGVACSAAGPLVLSREPVPTSAPASKAASAAQAAGVPAALPAAGGAALSTAASPPTAPNGAAQAQQADSTLADTSAQLLSRMVIRSAQLTVEVPDIEQALAQARAIASRSGGFVSASNTHVERANDQDRMVADLTLQVRSDTTDSAISDLRALGKVSSENTGSQDVTDEYVDLDSNLRNLQASESAILKLMDKATQIQDVLSLQRELTNVRGQIERIQGRKTYLERRTDMATISVSLRLPAAPSTQPLAGGWDPVGTAQRGWQASLTLLRTIADGMIVALAFSWWLVPFVAAGVYFWLHRRRGAVQVATPAESA